MQTAPDFSQFKLAAKALPGKGWGRVISLCLLALVIVGGCGKDDQEAAGKKAFAIEKEYRRGPVTFKIKLSRKEITIAERLRLVLEVSAQENYETKLPEFGEKLEQFGIVDYTASPPRLGPDGRVVSSKTYELEPFLSGKYLIPPMRVTFWKKGEEKKHQFESEPLEVLVKSLLPKDAKLAIREIAPPGELPAPARGWLYLLAGIIAAILLAVLAIFIRRKRQANKEEIAKKTAQEIAYEELEALLARDLIARGEIKEFYLCLSNILRHYIENRFSLHAPERTTEEFLTELKAASMLSLRHKQLLKEFLQHCDLVKFAEHLPADEEIQKTFDTCKQFFFETGQEETREGVDPAARRRKMEH